MTAEQKKQKKNWREYYQQTIPDELLAQWKKLRRKGDAAFFVKKLKVSRPIVDAALLHGHVKEDRIRKFISDYFEQRALDEKSEAERLGALSSPTTETNS